MATLRLIHAREEASKAQTVHTASPNNPVSAVELNRCLAFGQQAESELAETEHEGAAEILGWFKATRDGTEVLTAAVEVDNTLHVATAYAENAYFLVAVPCDRVAIF
jgi:hypothetical protein